MSSAKKKKTLHVFDFDGVLAESWTHPELHFGEARLALSELKKNSSAIMCVASFNPRAELAIRDYWKLDDHFEAFRYGSNKKWDRTYGNHLRIGMSKSNQILDMISDELADHKFDEIFFYDDDLLNIKEVNKALPYVKTVLIDSRVGLTLNDIVCGDSDDTKIITTLIPPSSHLGKRKTAISCNKKTAKMMKYEEEDE